MASVRASIARGSRTLIGLGHWIGTLYFDQFEDLPILRLLYEYGFRSSIPSNS